MVIQYMELHDAGDLLANNRFQFLFGTIPGGGDVRDLSFMCDHVGVPGREVGHTRVNLMGFSVGYRGNRTTENTLDATFYETQRGTVYRALTGWMQFALDPVTRTGPLKQEYATTCKLKIFDTVGAIAFDFDLSGVWPISVRFGELQEDASGPVKHEVQFNVDWTTLTNANPITPGTTGRITTLTNAETNMQLGVGRTQVGNILGQPMALTQFAQRFLR